MADLVADPSPCVPLRAVALQVISEPPLSGDTVTAQKVKCDPKQVCRTWRGELLKPKVDWRSDVLELMLSVTARSGKNDKIVKCLVDTGARLPITVRDGFFREGRVRKAKYPVKFTTVSGVPMKGGQRGLFLSLMLPVCRRDDTFTYEKTNPLFGYEADMRTSMELMRYCGIPF